VGLLSRIAARNEARNWHPSTITAPQRLFPGGSISDATGRNLSPDQALSLPAVLQAVRLISWSLAMLPWPVYECEGPSKRKKLRKAEDHPLYWILEKEPNREQTPFEFKTEIIANALLRGDSYNQVTRRRDGSLLEVWPLDTDRMQVYRSDTQLRYDYLDTAGKTWGFDSKDNEILHVKGFTDRGFMGYATTQRAATAFGKLKAMEEFGGRVFKNGVSTGSIVEADEPYKMEASEAKAFVDKLSDSLTGEKNAHRVALLPHGMKLRALGFTAQEAQLLEGMTFQVQEVARVFGIPPHLLMELSKATFSNIEHQMIQFIQLTLGPWMTNIEQRFERTLLTREERKTYYIEFMVDALLRTDIKTRFEALRIAVGQPWMSVNEGRDKLNMNPVKGHDEIAQPLNMGNPGGNPDLTKATA